MDILICYLFSSKATSKNLLSNSRIVYKAQRQWSTDWVSVRYLKSRWLIGTDKNSQEAIEPMRIRADWLWSLSIRTNPTFSSLVSIDKSIVVRLNSLRKLNAGPEQQTNSIYLICTAAVNSEINSKRIANVEYCFGINGVVSEPAIRWSPCFS